MEQKQRIVIFIILILFFLSIVLTEMKLWSSINLKNINVVIKIIAPTLQLLVVSFCFRFYRAFTNPFFKFQGIALAVGVLNAGVYELRSIIVEHLLYNNKEALHQIVSTYMNSISMIVNLIGILIALYGLLQYRESWEQDEKVS
ncbi:MAG: hypothetical protein PHT62_07325 [Desulfotomaculaceae bacterium]|nr:hypothetical protein [Desulfotomaculaceae bacterium]